MASARRVEKLNELFKEEITKILAREFDFPENTIVTITHVATTQDMHYATVFVSLISAHPKETLAILSKKIYTVQQSLNRRVRMRPVPRISFAVDEAEMRREKVERSLAELKRKGDL